MPWGGAGQTTAEESERKLAKLEKNLASATRARRKCVMSLANAKVSATAMG